MTRERRRSPRVRLAGQLQGQVASEDLPLTVREISLGGMSIEAPRSFPIGSASEFVLTLGDGAGVAVIGRVIYSREMAGALAGTFITGIQFLDEDLPDEPADVGGLINRLT